jgi:dolichol-phosphate mannosyltransferase
MSEAAASGHALQLAVVVPTYNERANVRPFLEGLKRALSGIAYEVIFVDDDSPDSTADEIRAIGILDPGVRVIQRIQRRGLASACIEGMMATSAPVIAVMDADLQHDERILPVMLGKLLSDNLDLVVATRKAEGGSMGGFGRSRLFLSNLGSRLSQSIIGCHISDPMSGFFLVRREYIHEVVRSASGVGFKILLDLVASAKRPIAVGEVPYTFRERLHGTSKLDLLVGIEYLELLLDKKIGRLVPVRFILFSMVGAAGVLASTIVLYTSVKFFHTGFFSGQIIATLVSMTGNFLLNNSMTYRDRRLKGRQLVSGLITFYLACSVGAVINVRIAELALSLGSPWLIAGAIGLGVGAVWNYGMTSFFTWRLEQRQR